MTVPCGSLLIVDDNDLNRDMLSRRLARLGFETQTAGSGRAALDLIETDRFDLVLLDIMMPDLDGVEVLKSIRRAFSAQRLPVIMVTARDQSEDVVAALKCGANDYITKPIDFPAALARVQTQLARKQADDALQKHQAAMEAAIDGMAILDESRHCRYVNAALVRLFGYSDASELIGKPWSLLYGDESRRLEQEFVPALRQQGRWHGEAQGLRRDGSRFDQELSLAAIDSGGFVCVVRDITQRKWIERELLAARSVAEAASRAKSDFLANMSHEIRTPMNGIIGMTELALHTDLTPDQQDYLQVIKQSADSLLRVLNDILDFSKIEAGKMELESIDFDLRDCLGDTVRALAVRAAEKQLELALHIPPAIPETLIGDPGRLRQVVVNLVGNAIKFTPAGEVVVDVQIETTSPEQIELHFSVRDTGIGISADKQKLIFDAFTQADTSTTREFGGSGLGLAVSSKLVALMGGRMWVESEIGRGSQFHFTARLGADAAAPPRLRLDRSALRDLAVLIVDDNHTNRRIVEEILSNWGLRPTTVDSGAAALDELARAAAAGQPFHLVVLDILMPRMDGFQVAEQIRNNPAVAATRIIVLSSAARPGDSARGRRLGISRCLSKPVKQSDLLDAVLQALGSVSIGPRKATTRPLPELTAPLRILLVEDGQVNQKVAVGFLTLRGHSVEVAGNGREALEALDREAFDVVLMDVEMPGMDGFEATAAIRRRQRAAASHTPIVAMTAHAMKGDRERCLQAGMDDYLSKPIDPAELYATVEKFTPHAALARPAGGAASSDASHARQPAAPARWNEADELQREINAAFLQECPTLVAEIEAALAAGDAIALGRAAHKLKGAAGVLSATPVVDAASALELFARQGDLPGARTAFPILAQAADRELQGLAGGQTRPSR
jgi:PAS domain S-box-containing protein